MKFSFTFSYNTRAVSIEGEADVHGQPTIEEAEALLRNCLSDLPREAGTLRVEPRDDAPPKEE